MITPAPVDPPFQSLIESGDLGTFITAWHAALRKRAAPPVGLLPSGETLAHFAAYHDQLEILQFLASAGALLFDASSGRSPLHWAVQGNSFRCVAFLLRCGADPNQEDSAGFTALTYAVMGGYLPIVHILCVLGQQPSVRPPPFVTLTPPASGAATAAASAVPTVILGNPRVVDNDGHSLVQWAAYRGHTTVIDYLVLCCGLSVHLADSEGSTALHWAAREGHLQSCIRLLLLGARVGATNSNGSTAEAIAASRGHVQTAHVLRRVARIGDTCVSAEWTEAIAAAASDSAGRGDNATDRLLPSSFRFTHSSSCSHRGASGGEVDCSCGLMRPIASGVWPSFIARIWEMVAARTPLQGVSTCGVLGMYDESARRLVLSVITSTLVLGVCPSLPPAVVIVLVACFMLLFFVTVKGTFPFPLPQSVLRGVRSAVATVDRVVFGAGRHSKHSDDKRDTADSSSHAVGGAAASRFVRGAAAGGASAGATGTFTSATDRSEAASAGLVSEFGACRALLRGWLCGRSARNADGVSPASPASLTPRTPTEGAIGMRVVDASTPAVLAVTALSGLWHLWHVTQATQFGGPSLVAEAAAYYIPSPLGAPPVSDTAPAVGDAASSPSLSPSPSFLVFLLRYFASPSIFWVVVASIAALAILAANMLRPGLRPPPPMCRAGWLSCPLAVRSVEAALSDPPQTLPPLGSRLRKGEVCVGCGAVSVTSLQTHDVRIGRCVTQLFIADGAMDLIVGHRNVFLYSVYLLGVLYVTVWVAGPMVLLYLVVAATSPPGVVVAATPGGYSWCGVETALGSVFGIPSAIGWAMNTSIAFRLMLGVGWPAAVLARSSYIGLKSVVSCFVVGSGLGGLPAVHEMGTLLYPNIFLSLRRQPIRLAPSVENADLVEVAADAAAQRRAGSDHWVANPGAAKGGHGHGGHGHGGHGHEP